MDRQVLLVSGASVIGLAGLFGGGLLLSKWLKSRNREENQYETDKSLNEYMAFHYTSSAEYVSFSAPQDALDFPLRCAELCMKNKSVGVLYYSVYYHIH